MAYVKCKTGTQDVCTHSYCQEMTPLCNEVNPKNPWRKCVLFVDHPGHHYVPPEIFNYDYWE